MSSLSLRSGYPAALSSTEALEQVSPSVSLLFDDKPTTVTLAAVNPTNSRHDLPGGRGGQAPPL